MKFLFLIPFIFLSIVTKAQCNYLNHWETVITDTSTWQYITPFYTIPNWQLSAFNANTWNLSQVSIGYGDADDSTIIAGNITSVYLRKQFFISDTNAIESLLLNIDYDDGYIAYLNGVEIARSNGMVGAIDFNSLSTVSHEAQLYQNGLPEATQLSPQLTHSIIVPGLNVLAVAVFNVDSNSSDLTIAPYLHVGIRNANTYFNTNPFWFFASNPFHTSELPILSINTNGQQINDATRIVSDLRIIDNGISSNCIFDSANIYKGNISIEYRGSTSQYFDKKPLGFSTIDQQGVDSNVSLWQYPEEHDWILLNTYNDKTFQRDELAYNLAVEMGWYASKTKHVIVYINQEYRGVYLLLEKIKRDKNRVDIKKLETNDTTLNTVSGGYIWKLDKYTGTVFPGFNSLVSNINYQYQYPKFDSIQPTQANYLLNYINTFETQLFSSHFESPDSGYRKYANVLSFIDEFLLIELANNVDGYRLSTFMHKDADNNCGRFTKGPIWDFNISFGNADYCNGGFAGWQISDGCGAGTSDYTLKMLQDTWFKNMTTCRWKELRQTIFSKDSLWQRIDAKSNYLRNEVQYDSTKYLTIGNYVWPNGWIANTWQGEVDSLKLWIEKRLNWIDSAINLQNINCNINSNMQVVVDEINYNDQTQNGAGDWLELWNTSNNTIDLSHAIIMNNKDRRKYCTLPRGIKLASNARLVIYNDSLKFASKHPTVQNKYGPLCFTLSNNGQNITIADSNNLSISNFNYGTVAPWPIGANGLGRTLQLKNATLNSTLPNSWIDGCPDGTPGLPLDPLCFSVGLQQLNVKNAIQFENPINEQIIFFHLPTTAAYVELYSISGSLIFKKKAEHIIDVKELLKGIYILKIMNNEGATIFASKVIKQ